MDHLLHRPTVAAQWMGVRLWKLQYVPYEYHSNSDQLVNMYMNATTRCLMMMTMMISLQRLRRNSYTSHCPRI
jgi:hypothetical protein